MLIERKHFNLKQYCVIEKLRIQTPFRQSASLHNEACFLFIKEGESILNSSTENLKIQIAESVLLKCGNYFADLIQKSGNKICEIYVIHLHKDILLEIYKDEVPNFVSAHGGFHFAQKIERQEIITHYIESLEFYFRNPALVNDELLKLKLKELILLLLQTNNAQNIMSLFAHLFTPRQANFREVIQTHLWSGISIPELATLTGRSISAFKRDFENYYKDTPANYLKEQKLQKAMELLESTDFTIGTICYEVGFSDTSHFTKLFKQKYELTPSEYRKNLINK